MDYCTDICSWMHFNDHEQSSNVIKGWTKKNAPMPLVGYELAPGQMFPTLQVTVCGTIL